MVKDTKITCRICENFGQIAFDELSDSELLELNDFKKTVFFKKGEMIQEEGRIPKGVFCIRKGKVKLFTRGFKGKEQILKIVKSGSIVGYHALLTNENAPVSAVVLEDLYACFIPRAYFSKMLVDNLKFNIKVMDVAVKDLSKACKVITSFAQKTVRERLADKFLALEADMGLDNEGFIDVVLTREEIANMIGTATESAIRLISEFKSDGLIEVKGRRYRLLNSDGLRHVSTF